MSDLLNNTQHERVCKFTIFTFLESLIMKDDKRKKQRNRVRPLLVDRYGAMDALGVGITKVDEWIRTGQLKSCKVGGSRRIHTKDLWDFAWQLRCSGDDDNTSRKFEV